MITGCPTPPCIGKCTAIQQDGLMPGARAARKLRDGSYRCRRRRSRTKPAQRCSQRAAISLPRSAVPVQQASLWTAGQQGGGAAEGRATTVQSNNKCLPRCLPRPCQPKKKKLGRAQGLHAALAGCNLALPTAGQRAMPRWALNQVGVDNRHLSLWHHPGVEMAAGAPAVRGTCNSFEYT